MTMRCLEVLPQRRRLIYGNSVPRVLLRVVQGLLRDGRRAASLSRWGYLCCSLHQFCRIFFVLNDFHHHAVGEAHNLLARPRDGVVVYAHLV